MNRIKFSSLTLVFFLLLSLLSNGCKDSGGSQPQACNFDTEAMLQHLGENKIFPGFKALAESTSILEFLANNFTGAPDSTNLVALRKGWKKAYLDYQQVSIYAFGPAVTAFQGGDEDFTFRNRFNVFPTNTANIETNIATANVTDINALFKSQVGFPAIAYLIFGENGQSIEDVTDRYFNSPNANFRKLYLNSLVGDLASRSRAISRGWNPSVGDYLSTFAANTGSAEGSSLSLLTNEFNFDFEILKNFKFKRPLGKFGDGTPEPETVEAFHAGISLELAQAQASHDLYRGVAANGNTGSSFYDYLICLKAGEDGGVLLADDIESQYQKIFTQLNLLSDPFSETVVSNQGGVDEAHVQMQIMVPLIKREMVSAFGVRINYQDNDGD